MGLISSPNQIESDFQRHVQGRNFYHDPIPDIFLAVVGISCILFATTPAGGGKEMISLAYCSARSFTTPNCCHNSLLPNPTNNNAAPKSSSIIQFSSHHHHHKTSFHPLVLVQNENATANTPFGRRETIGLSALGFGLFNILSQPQQFTAAAAETVPCELTVAPSGLGFCDKVVGNGPQAVKGQLIKVTFWNLTLFSFMW